MVSGAIERTNVLLFATPESTFPEKIVSRAGLYASPAALNSLSQKRWTSSNVVSRNARSTVVESVEADGAGRVAADALGNFLRSLPENDPSDTVDVVDECVAAEVDVKEW